MSRLDKDQINLELAQKQLKLSDSSPDYKNLTSPIIVECVNSHKIHTTLKTVRMVNFACPMCVGEKTKGFSELPTEIPVKKGYRIVGIDNATYNMGVSIFEDGKLIYFGLIKFHSDNHVKRLLEIRDFVEQVLIPEWKPDFLQFEDIQHQNSYAAYEILIKLVGIIEMACERFKISCEKTRANVWRSSFGINGAKRAIEKERAIKLVKEMYDIDVTDDVAEAILIAKYRYNEMARNKIKDLF